MLTPDTRIDRRIILEAKSLVKTGKEVIIIARNNGRLPEEATMDGVTIKRPPYKFTKLNKLNSFITLKSGYDARLAETVLQHTPDVVHIHDLPALRAGILVSERLKVPLIYDMHEFYPEQHKFSFWKKFYWERLEKKYIYKANIIITVNEMLAREIERHYPGLSIGVIQNAVNLPEDFDLSRRYNLFREEYNVPEDSILLLYQGWIAPDRNLEIIIRGMRHLSSSKLYLLIMGYGGYANDLQKLVKYYQLDKKVLFIPAKSQEQLLYYTASADIGIIPYPYGMDVNTNFASPNKLYEFIAAGIPILANNLSFIKKVIDENKFGVCTDIQSEQKFANAAQQFTPEKLTEYRQAIRNNRKKFMWNAEAEKLIKSYDSL